MVTLFDNSSLQKKVIWNPVIQRKQLTFHDAWFPHKMMSVQMTTEISYWWFNINFAPVRMPLISVLLLLSCRVQLPWTEAFSAVPIICFGFQVCTSLAIYNHKICLFTGKQLQLYTVGLKVCFKHLPTSCTWKLLVAYPQEIILFSNFPWINPKHQAKI